MQDPTFSTLVPEWLMALSAFVLAAMFLFRHQIGIKAQDEGRALILILTFMFSAQGMLCLIIEVSGSRSGWAWTVRLNLFTFIVVLILYNLKVLWQHYYGRSNGSSGSGDIDRIVSSLNGGTVSEHGGALNEVAISKLRDFGCDVSNNRLSQRTTWRVGRESLDRKVKTPRRGLVTQFLHRISH